jgi:hypothetical protein
LVKSASADFFSFQNPYDPTGRKRVQAHQGSIDDPRAAYHARTLAPSCSPARASTPSARTLPCRLRATALDGPRDGGSGDQSKQMPRDIQLSPSCESVPLCVRPTAAACIGTKAPHRQELPPRTGLARIFVPLVRSEKQATGPAECTSNRPYARRDCYQKSNYLAQI